MKELRDYQINIAEKANVILKDKKIVVLNCMVRVGKTLMALETCKNYGALKVLFITKIKAFSSIKSDYKDFGYTFDITIINKESIHKVEGNEFDIIVCDESHGLFGTFPKPNNFTKEYIKRFSKIPMILMTGTLTPESYSQIYWQFNVSAYSPFNKYVNFYKWSKDFVNITQKRLGYAIINDYSDANQELIKKHTDPYILTFTQLEAGFTSEVKEIVLEVEMMPITYQLINKLRNDLVVISKKTGKQIIADTGVKLQLKHLQLASGTIKFEDETSTVIDYSKAEFIKSHFKDIKIAIFYKFKEELTMLKEVYKDDLTTDLEDFNNSKKSIAYQFQSGREGVNLSKAKHLVALNIDFSATTYFQFRARTQTIDRNLTDLYWIFSKPMNGVKSIERFVYKAVMNKKKYTQSAYDKDFKQV